MTSKLELLGLTSRETCSSGASRSWSSSAIDESRNTIQRSSSSSTTVARMHQPSWSSWRGGAATGVLHSHPSSSSQCASTFILAQVNVARVPCEAVGPGLPHLQRGVQRALWAARSCREWPCPFVTLTSTNCAGPSLPISLKSPSVWFSWGTVRQETPPI
jgi:hypothetical protein